MAVQAEAPALVAPVVAAEDRGTPARVALLLQHHQVKVMLEPVHLEERLTMVVEVAAVQAQAH